MSFCCGSENEERIKRRMQRKNQKRSDEYNENRAELEKYNENRYEQELAGRELGTYTFNRIKGGNYWYRDVERNQHNIPNSFQYPTHSFYGKPMTGFYGQPMNMNTSSQSKSKIDNYYNDKEGAYIDQGNICRNEGYSYTGDIFGKREQKYKKCLKKLGGYFNDQIKKDEENISNIHNNNCVNEIVEYIKEEEETKKKEEKDIQNNSSYVIMNIYSGGNKNANGY